MRGNATRTHYTHVGVLTPAERRMLEEYAATRCFRTLPERLGVSKGCIQMRGKTIREKLCVRSLDEALEAVR